MPARESHRSAVPRIEVPARPEPPCLARPGTQEHHPAHRAAGAERQRQVYGVRRVRVPQSECFTVGLRKAWDKRGRFKELRHAWCGWPDRVRVKVPGKA